MKHGRDDYDQRRDIPENEPVFVIRAQDLAAPATLRFYAMEAHRVGASTDLVSSVLDHARSMERWQREVARKTPDLKAVP